MIKQSRSITGIKINFIKGGREGSRYLKAQGFTFNNGYHKTFTKDGVVWEYNSLQEIWVNKQ